LLPPEPRRLRDDHSAWKIRLHTALSGYISEIKNSLTKVITRIVFFYYFSMKYAHPVRAERHQDRAEAWAEQPDAGQVNGVFCAAFDECQPS